MLIPDGHMGNQTQTRPFWNPGFWGSFQRGREQADWTNQVFQGGEGEMGSGLRSQTLTI